VVADQNGDGSSDIIFGGVTIATSDSDTNVDLIFGGVGSDQIDAGAGNDIIFGGTGGVGADTDGDGTSDIIFGGAAVSTSDNDASSDIIFGGVGADRVDGGTGDDIIFGGTAGGIDDTDTGNDIIFGGIGADQVDAGAGDDIIFGGTAGGTSDTDTGSDIIFGGVGGDQIDAGAGNDIIFGGTAGGTSDTDGGSDIIFGGIGADQVDGGGGNDIIFGGTTTGTSDADAGGSDIIFGGTGVDAIDGGQGDDIIFGGTGGVVADQNGDGTSDIIFGGVTVGSSDSDTNVDLIFGGVGSDQIDAGAGNDIIFGGTGGVGADTDGDGTSDIIFGGASVSTSDNDASSDIIFGGVGADRVDGGTGDDIIFGGTAGGVDDTDTGNDIIFGGVGSDQVDAGAGNDIIFGGTALGTADTDATGNDIIFGGIGLDQIDGGAGDDVIYGGVTGGASDTDTSGTDIIFGGLGTDQIDGGGGDDIIFGGTAGASSDADDTGSDIIYGGVGLDQLDGGDGNDVIFGGTDAGTADTDSGGNDIIYGGLGQDQVDGGSGSDIIYGGVADGLPEGDTGADIIYGGMGGDLIDAGDGDDIIFGGTAGGADDADSGGSDIIYGGLGLDQVDAGGGNDIIFGGAGDPAFADPGGDIIFGGAGDDFISGEAGNDALNGGAGNDVYLFVGGNLGSDTVTESPGADSDTLDFSSFAGSVTLDLAVATAQTVNAGNLTLTLSSDTSIEHVIGTSFADTVSGNSRDNQLVGADILDDRVTSTLPWDGRTQVVYLDFDFSTGVDEDGDPRTEHLYTQAERDAIHAAIAADFAQFHFSFTQVCPVSVPAGTPCVGTDFTTIFFNKTPVLPNGQQIAGGIASEKDFRNVNLGGTASIEVNQLLGGLGEPSATSANFIALSATVGAHELGHLSGIAHADAFGPPGFGIHSPPGPDQYLPFYPGPISAYETPLHLIASPASVGSTLFDAVGDPFFGEREAIKIAFAESGSVVGESAAAGSLSLVGLNVPNTLVNGLNAGKAFAVAAVDVVGSIGLGVDGRSESDTYTFEGQAGDLINIELMSRGLQRITSTIDSVLRVRDSSGSVIAFYQGTAVNDDTFEPTDSSITDLILPADGTYTIEVDTFSLYADPACAGAISDVCADTDTGDYELFVYRFDAGNVSDGGDTLDGRGGDDRVVGGLGDDNFPFSASIPLGAETVIGGAGTDCLDLRAAPAFTVAAIGPIGVECLKIQSVSGAASAAEGSSYSLALFSGDGAPTGWDINWGDGTTSTISGNPASVTHSFGDGPNDYSISASATYWDGTFAALPIAVHVTNVAPVVAAITGPTPGPIGVPGQILSFASSFSDPGLLDTQTVSWNFGDGTPTVGPTNAPTGAIAATHVFTATGTFTITLTVLDDDGGATTVTKSVTIATVAIQSNVTCGPGGSAGTALVVGGSNNTALPDNLVVNSVTGTPGALNVKNGGTDLGSFSTPGGFSRIIVFAQAGDDRIQVVDGITLPSCQFGGDGNDQLNGGGGGNILVGGNGNDVLNGGNGRDLMIGGFGGDTINGNANDDILVAGYTDYDANDLALSAIMNEWVRTDINYSTRVSHILGSGVPANGSSPAGTAGGLNGSYNLFGDYVNASGVIVIGTSHDDNVKDTLKGNAGVDWFLANLNNTGDSTAGVLDAVTSSNGEALSDID
jgi:Ca2+-binding RTX toxin-like protein